MASTETWVTLAGVAAAAGLAANATATHAGTTTLFDTPGIDPPSLWRGTDLDEPDRVGLVRSVERALKEARRKVLAYNVFCPTCLPPPTADKPRVTGQGRESLDPLVVKCALNLQLVGTMEAVHPRPSYVTIYDADAGTMGLYTMEDSIRPDVVVARIDQGLLHVRHGSRLEYLELGPITAPPPPSAGAAPKPRRVPKGAIVGAAEAIECKSDNLCLVDRGFVDTLLANPGLAVGQARFNPKKKDGRIVGYAVYGVRKGSLPKLFGLENADVITGVNGVDLTSVDAVMGLYAKLRHASQLEVTILRRGKALTKEVQIR